MPDVSPDEAELEELLTQLLRVVSPGLAPSGGNAAPNGESVSGEDRAVLEASAKRSATGRQASVPPRSAGLAADYEAGGRPADADIRGLSLSPSEARALIELVAARGIAQGELAGLLGLEKSTVSRLAAGLERKGWVRRGRDEDNQRYLRLYLTSEGSEVAARVWRAWQSRQARILAALSADERAGLSAGLRGLVRGLAAEGLLAESPGTGSSAGR
ncbi:MAG: MarR family winged helix-turn-helix transcriptional regulator [Streptosporangiaceae bacterium]